MLAQCPLERQIQKLKSHLAQRPNDKPSYRRLMDLEIALFNQKNGLVKSRSKPKSKKAKIQIDKVFPNARINKGEPGAPKHVLMAPVPILQGATHVVWNSPIPKDKTKTSKRQLPIVETDRVLCSPAWLEFELPYDADARKSVVNYFSKNFSCNVGAYIKLWLHNAFDNDTKKAREYIASLVPTNWNTLEEVLDSVRSVYALTGEEAPKIDVLWAEQNLNKFIVSMQQRVRDMITDYLLQQVQHSYDIQKHNLPSDFVITNGLKTSLRVPFESMCRSYLTNLMRGTCAKQSAEQSRLLRLKADKKIALASKATSDSKAEELILQANVLIAKAEAIEKAPAVSGFPLISEDVFSLNDATVALNDFHALLQSDEIIGNHQAVNELRSVVQAAITPRSQQVVRGWERNHTVIAKGMVAQRQQSSIVYNTATQNIEMVIACGENGFKQSLDDLVYLDGEPMNVDNQITSKQSTHKLVSKPRHDYIRWHNKHVHNHDANAPAYKRGFCRSFQFVIVQHKQTGHLRMFVRPLFNFATPSEGYLNFGKEHEFKYSVGVDVGVNNVFRASVFDNEQRQLVEIFMLEHDKIHRIRVSQQISKLQSKLDSSKTLKQSDIVRLRREISKLRKQLRDLKTPIRKAVAEMVDIVEQKYGRGNYCFWLEGIKPNELFNSKNMARLRHLTAIGFTQEALVAQLSKLGYRSFEVNGKVMSVCLRFTSAYGTSKITPSGAYLSEGTDEMHGRNIGRFVSKTPDQNGDYPIGELLKTQGSRHKVLHVKNQAHADWGQELMRDVDGKIYNADEIASINIAIRPFVQAKYPGLKQKELCEAQAKFMSEVQIVCELDTYEVQSSKEFGQVLKKRRKNPS